MSHDRGGPHPSDRGLIGLRCRSGVGFMPPRCSCPAVREVRADRSMLHHVPQQVREDLVFRVGAAGVRTPIYRLQAHLPHPSDDSLPVDPMPLPAKHPGHLASSEERCVQEDLVQPLHQRQILRRLTGSLVSVLRGI